MIRVLTAALLAGSFAFSAIRTLAVTPPAALDSAAPQGGCVNLFPQEPLIVFDISGFTLTGMLHQHFAVYSSGLVSISEAGGGGGSFPFGSKADMTFVAPEEAKKLWSKVVQAGAMSICDIPSFVNDAPLTTVTVHRGDTNSQAHTYSYYDASTPESAAVQDAIQKFMTATFPNF
jgi:hypothetical protein